MAAKKPRILLACVRQAYTRLFAILSGHELEFVTTLIEAQAALKGNPFDLVMIGLHFDESRMFDLLEQVRADARYARVPVVCFHGILSANPQDDLKLEPIEVACKALGANVFFDLLAYPDDTAGNAAIRSIVNRVINTESNQVG
jgi:CheY-like chemotaxis protein